VESVSVASTVSGTSTGAGAVAGAGAVLVLAAVVSAGAVSLDLVVVGFWVFLGVAVAGIFRYYIMEDFF